MKKILVSLICCLTATLGWAQEKNAYTLFDAQGNRVDYTQMMDVLERQDVVFIGEIHNCPIAHWMEYEIVKDLYDRHGDRLMIGAEMFERDNQLILDEYLAGMITPERFNAEAKLWPNYKTDYSPIVEFAKEHKIPFVATNVARRYANMVAKGGFEALDGLSDEAYSWRSFTARINSAVTAGIQCIRAKPNGRCSAATAANVITRKSRPV